MREYLRINFDRADRTYRVGETVKGKVLIGSPHGDQCNAVRLKRFWRTHGTGSVDKGDPTVTRLHLGPLSTEHLHEFEFEFPAPPGPYTYHGHNLNVDQYVEVEVDLPWTQDPKRLEDYVLLPGTPPAPPPSLLETVEFPVEKLVPGCGAAIGSLAMVAGVIALFSYGPMALLFFLAGGTFYLPYVKSLSERRLGKSASAYLSSLVVCPGREVEVEVKVAPPKQVQLNRAYMEVKAEEVCTFGSGSNRRTQRHKVFSAIQPLSGAVALEGGKVKIMNGSVRVPEEAPNSFKGGANKLIWEATVWLDIPSWPDWVKRIPFVVWPNEPLLPKVEEPEALPASPEEPLVPEPLTAPGDLPSWLANLESPGMGPVAEEGDEPGSAVEIEAEGGEPEPAVEIEAEGGEPPGSLNEAVTAILDAKIFGGEKDLLIKDLLGRAVEITLEVKRVDRSFGAFSATGYRNGQTVTGTVLGSDLEVAVFFPEERNEEVKGWEIGSSYSVRGEVRDWDRLRKRPELLAKG